MLSKLLEYLFIKRIQIMILSISLISFILIALDVLFNGVLAQFDKILSGWSMAWHTPSLDQLLFNITKMGNLSTMLLLSSLVTIFLLWKKDRSGLIFYWITMLGSGATFSGLKEIFARTRPSSHIGDYLQHGYSFPSGHATMSMTFALLLFYLFYHRVSESYRVVLVAFSLLFPLLISFSRIYLGVHYLSDILAGIMAGIFWALLVILLLKPKSYNRDH